MSRPSRRRLRSADEGVSEVISYLFSFAMSVLILSTSFYAFSQINEAARALGAEAQVREVGSRVALGVQEALLVAAARQESIGSANTSVLRYSRAITVPIQVQGWDYTIQLDASYVNATVASPGIHVPVSNLNAAVLLPPAGVCAATYVVCAITGSNGGDRGQIAITYEFNDTAVPTVSRISIT